MPSVGRALPEASCGSCCRRACLQVTGRTRGAGRGHRESVGGGPRAAFRKSRDRGPQAGPDSRAARRPSMAQSPSTWGRSRGGEKPRSPGPLFRELAQPWSHPIPSAYPNVANEGSPVRRPLPESWLCLLLAAHMDKPRGFCGSVSWNKGCGLWGHGPSQPQRPPQPPLSGTWRRRGKCAAGPWEPGQLSGQETANKELLSDVSADRTQRRPAPPALV